MFSKKTCGLPSNRPWTVGDSGPYKICGIFDILSVGEDIILPSFIKISLRFARAFKERPYGFGVFLNSMPVGEHSICSQKGTGGYGIRPYGFFVNDE